MNDTANHQSPDHAEEVAQGSSTYQVNLKEVQEQLESGRTPTPTTVRQFLKWFGYARRGRWVVNQIRDALHEFSLHTDPDFEYAWIDAPIVFLAAAARPQPSNQSPSETDSSGQASAETGPTEGEGTVAMAAYADPTYRIGKLSFANRPPVSIHPDRDLMEALTVMMMHDYSQLPVMTSEREVRGLISWKSIALRAAMGAPHERVSDCMGDSPEIVSDDDSLFRVINKVVDQECVLVRDKTKKISGIVTASDLSETFHQLGRPFLLLGEVENLIRGLLDGKFSADELQRIRNPDDSGRPVEDISDLTFGEYVRLVQEPDRWNRLGLRIDRTTFVKDLERVNDIRNDVMHFDPEGITSDELDELRKTAKFLQDVRAVHQAILSAAT
jgi:CBS domain-containing protein